MTSAEARAALARELATKGQSDLVWAIAFGLTAFAMSVAVVLLAARLAQLG